MMQRHFQRLMLLQLSGTCIIEKVQPLFHALAERHTTLLLDFVFSGVALSKPFRVSDEGAMIHVEAWDNA
ncbi:hypothetical protein [Brucella grignonensis]|uniref:Uncharacterized protein n=1 Tax=Brucella grignonensis TaxID=94627 RepID=A0A256F0Q4_9HYPH|nr:hypothetical protein [Brucella grignonensis]OYR08373.1 hypothetical protein CEV33_3337 [Brucella grignonensis]